MSGNTDYTHNEFEREKRDSRTWMRETPPVRPVIGELLLGANDMIVELGSANSSLTLSIARLLKNRQGIGEIIACDFSRSRVRWIAREAATVGVEDHLDVCCLSDAPPGTLPFDDAVVNIVLSVNMIQYLSEPSLYLQEISRVLAPCGTLLVADWDSSRSANGETPQQKKIEPEQLHSMLDAAGLDANRRIDLAGYNWAFLAVKPVLLTI